MVLYATGCAFVALAGTFGMSFLVRQEHPLSQPASWMAGFASWDGVWYSEIAMNGYTYNSNRASNVVFFPALPCFAWTVRRFTSIPIEASLLLVAHVSLGATYLLLPLYSSVRITAGARDAESPRLCRSVVVLLTFWPLSYFFHMAYTESLFLLTSMAAMHAMHSKAPAWQVALLVGLATATRTVGVALLAPLLIHLWERRYTERISLLAVSVPLSCWGLLAYIAHLQCQFGDGLVCIQNQFYWNRRPPLEGFDYWLALLSLEPFWSVYDAQSEGYWGRYELPPAMPIFSLFFWNPIIFSASAILLGVGCSRRWITDKEAALSAGLLIIPYVTNAHGTMMQSHGRYALLAFPLFFVAARIYNCLPREFQSALLMLFAGGQFVLTALFVSWYRVC